jgi:hypothetical protein
MTGRHLITTAALLALVLLVVALVLTGAMAGR